MIGLCEWSFPLIWAWVIYLYGRTPERITSLGKPGFLTDMLP